MKSVLFWSGSLIHDVGDLFYKLCAEASLVSKQGSYLGRSLGMEVKRGRTEKIIRGNANAIQQESLIEQKGCFCG
jgi:hypothetical protein